MGIDAVGAFNDKLGLKTPHLDRLVSEGMPAILRRYIEEGRSTPGPRQPNHDNAIHWRNVPWEKPTAKPTAPLF